MRFPLSSRGQLHSFMLSLGILDQVSKAFDASHQRHIHFFQHLGSLLPEVALFLGSLIDHVIHWTYLLCRSLSPTAQFPSTANTRCPVSQCAPRGTSRTPG